MPLLALLAVGFAGGIAVHRASFTALGLGVGSVLLAMVVVAVARRRGRTGRDELQETGSPGPAPAPVVGGRQKVRPLLFFYYGYWPAYLLGDLSASTAALVLLGSLVLTLLVLLAVRAARLRRATLARAAHPHAAVVVGVLFDLASMRLMQWARASGSTLPFVSGGAVAVVADEDGVVLERIGPSYQLVHRWAWEDVEVCSRPRPDGALLVLTLEGPTPAPRARAVPVTRRRFEITLALRATTLAGMVLPTPLAAVEIAVTALMAQRPAGGAAAGPHHHGPVDRMGDVEGQPPASTGPHQDVPGR